ncbi:transducin family protein / WD-40 repeat family protein [Striga asiatica]|uniref:Transducin family protein / WD-40 repeat family protein n=1 Tax=Striga asiatica TaxID=4170 RepID=A0A5A7PTW6_STRAF|nr:transducin family protein / WD-40 repeat family protein [Striga asiatica]
MKLAMTVGKWSELKLSAGKTGVAGLRRQAGIVGPSLNSRGGSNCGLTVVRSRKNGVAGKKGCRKNKMRVAGLDAVGGRRRVFGKMGWPENCVAGKMRSPVSSLAIAF